MKKLPDSGKVGALSKRFYFFFYPHSSGTTSFYIVTEVNKLVNIKERKGFNHDSKRENQ
jgi:hypothetical protein